jgi:hypothetical protein
MDNVYLPKNVFILKSNKLSFLNLINGGCARNNFKNNFVGQLFAAIYVNIIENTLFALARQIWPISLHKFSVGFKSGKIAGYNNNYDSV